MISVDTRDIQGVSDALEKVSGTLYEKIVNVAIKDFLRSTQQVAKINHRYTRRTGNLERSVKVSLEKNGGSVYIDEGQAHYGKFVHNGQRSWAPDPFVYDAAYANLPDLDMKVSAAVDACLKESGF